MLKVSKGPQLNCCHVNSTFVGSKSNCVIGNKFLHKARHITFLLQKKRKWSITFVQCFPVFYGTVMKRKEEISRSAEKVARLKALHVHLQADEIDTKLKTLHFFGWLVNLLMNLM